MKLSKLLLTTMILAMTVTLVACKKEGPMEKAGKSMDKAAHEVEDTAKKAEKSVEDAIEDAKDDG